MEKVVKIAKKMDERKNKRRMLTKEKWKKKKKVKEEEKAWATMWGEMEKGRKHERWRYEKGGITKKNKKNHHQNPPDYSGAKREWVRDGTQLLHQDIINMNKGNTKLKPGSGNRGGRRKGRGKVKRTHYSGLPQGQDQTRVLRCKTKALINIVITTFLQLSSLFLYVITRKLDKR